MSLIDTDALRRVETHSHTIAFRRAAESFGDRVRFHIEQAGPYTGIENRDAEMLDRHGPSFRAVVSTPSGKPLAALIFVLSKIAGDDPIPYTVLFRDPATGNMIANHSTDDEATIARALSGIPDPQMYAREMLDDARLRIEVFAQVWEGLDADGRREVAEILGLGH